MAGNVWEWTSSLYEPYPYQADDERENLDSTNVRVLRGGGWNNNGSNVRSANRNNFDPGLQDYGIGFRCIR